MGCSECFLAAVVLLLGKVCIGQFSVQLSCFGVFWGDLHFALCSSFCCEIKYNAEGPESSATRDSGNKLLFEKGKDYC